MFKNMRSKGELLQFGIGLDTNAPNTDKTLISYS